MHNLLRWILNPWVILAGTLVGISLFGVTLLLLWLSHPDRSAPPPAEAAVTVIAAPTFTPILPTVAPTAVETPTAALPTPPPGIIAQGDLVQVTGTGGDGLRMRSEPGLGSAVIFIGLEAEVFKVTDGPRDADGYTWWHLVDPYNKDHQGWAVSNFLAAIQNP